MVLNLTLNYQATYQTPCQQAAVYMETMLVSGCEVAVAPPDNVVPIRRIPTLRKMARVRVSQFERDFLI